MISPACGGRNRLVTPEMCDRDITVRVLGIDGEHRDFAVSAHLCDENRELDGVECVIG